MVDTAQVAEHCIKLVALEPRTFAFATALNLMFVCDVTDERSIHLQKKKTCTKMDLYYVLINNVTFNDSKMIT